MSVYTVIFEMFPGSEEALAQKKRGSKSRLKNLVLEFNTCGTNYLSYFDLPS